MRSKLSCENFVGSGRSNVLTRPRGYKENIYKNNNNFKLTFLYKI